MTGAWELPTLELERLPWPGALEVMVSQYRGIGGSLKGLTVVRTLFRAYVGRISVDVVGSTRDSSFCTLCLIGLERRCATRVQHFRVHRTQILLPVVFNLLGMHVKSFMLEVILEWVSLARIAKSSE